MVFFNAYNSKLWEHKFAAAIVTMAAIRPARAARSGGTAALSIRRSLQGKFQINLEHNFK
ncbi:hypothetical protein EJB05_33232, partial [Eragrostis curvula]